MDDPARTRQLLRDWLCWVPNALTLSRLALALLLPWCPLETQFWVLVAAGLTDLFDGAVARALGLEPRYGQFLDPVADKTLVIVAVGLALHHGWLDWVWLILLLARDLTATILSLVALTRGRHNWRRLKPRLSGKLATAAQFLALGGVYWMRGPLPVLVGIAALISIASAADYTAWAIRMARAKEPGRTTHPG